MDVKNWEALILTHIIRKLSAEDKASLERQYFKAQKKYLGTQDKIDTWYEMQK